MRTANEPPTTVTINGETHTFRIWATITGLHEQTIRDRYNRGVTGENLIAPVDAKRQKMIESKRKYIHSVWGGKWVFPEKITITQYTNLNFRWI